VVDALLLGRLRLRHVFLLRNAASDNGLILGGNHILLLQVLKGLQQRWCQLIWSLVTFEFVFVRRWLIVLLTEMSRHRQRSTLFIDGDRVWVIAILATVVIVRSHHECFLRWSMHFVLLWTCRALNSLSVYLVWEARQLLFLIATATVQWIYQHSTLIARQRLSRTKRKRRIAL
jgi:hypothetical protein